MTIILPYHIIQVNADDTLEKIILAKSIELVRMANCHNIIIFLCTFKHYISSILDISNCLMLFSFLPNNDQQILFSNQFNNLNIFFGIGIHIYLITV